MKGTLDNYLRGTAIVGRVSTGTVAAAATRARHNLIGTASLALLVALQVGHIFNLCSGGAEGGELRGAEGGRVVIRLLLSRERKATKVLE